MKSALIVYYSRTGHTKKVAVAIAAMLNGEIEEIFDAKISRAGAAGWLRCGQEAFFKKCPAIKKPENNPAQYDLIVIGTPVWSFTMSSPIKTYLTQNKEQFNRLAFFCTHEGSPKNTLRDMESLSGKKPVIAVDFNKKEILDGNYRQKVKSLADGING